MSNDEIYEELKDKSFKGAKRGIHPVIKALQQKNAAKPQPPRIFEADVVALLHQNADDERVVQRINDVLRAMLG